MAKSKKKPVQTDLEEAVQKKGGAKGKINPAPDYEAVQPKEKGSWKIKQPDGTILNRQYMTRGQAEQGIVKIKRETLEREAKKKPPPKKMTEEEQKVQTAKNRKAIRGEEEAPEPKRKVRVLAPAWQGWPKVEKYGIYIHREGTFLGYVKFAATYAAKKFIEAVAKGEELELMPNNEISGGKFNFRLTDPDLAKGLVAHKYSEDEADWELPPPYDGYAAVMGGYTLKRLEALREAISKGDLATLKKKDRPPVVPGGKGDTVGKIKENMPISTKVRILAKQLSIKATGSKESWKQYKAQAEKELGAS